MAFSFMRRSSGRDLKLVELAKEARGVMVQDLFLRLESLYENRICHDRLPGQAEFVSKKI